MSKNNESSGSPEQLTKAKTTLLDIPKSLGLATRTQSNGSDKNRSRSASKSESPDSENLLEEKEGRGSHSSHTPPEGRSRNNSSFLTPLRLSFSGKTDGIAQKEVLIKAIDDKNVEQFKALLAVDRFNTKEIKGRGDRNGTVLHYLVHKIIKGECPLEMLEIALKDFYTKEPQKLEELKELLLEQNDNHETVLSIAVNAKNFAVVKAIARFGIGAFEETAITRLAPISEIAIDPYGLAAFIRDMSFIDDATKANPKLKTEKDRYSESGANALHLAIKHDLGIHVIKSLITRGVRVDEVNANGDTMAHLAARTGNIEVLKLFTSTQGFNWNAQNKDGETLAHIAARRGDVEMIKFLLITHKDFDFKPQNRKGETFIDLILQGNLDKGWEIERAFQERNKALEMEKVENKTELVPDVAKEEKEMSRKPKRMPKLHPLPKNLKLPEEMDKGILKSKLNFYINPPKVVAKVPEPVKKFADNRKPLNMSERVRPNPPFRDVLGTASTVPSPAAAVPSSNPDPKKITPVVNSLVGTNQHK